MKKGKKPKKRKRGAASRARVRLQGKEFVAKALERKLNQLKELKEETRDCYESVLEKHQLSEEEQEELEFEWGLCLQIISDYEDATPEELLDLQIETYNSEPLSYYIENEETSEEFLHASFDLANALGLALITIDETGNINGERVMY